VFAPVVILEPFDTLDQAVALANAPEYSLHAGVFTRDLSTALKLARRIEAGGVMINDSSDYRFDAMPFFASIATDENFARVERLQSFASQQGHTLLELAVAWLLAQDGVASVICGATSPAQVKANADATGWKLTADDLAEVERLVS